MNYRIKRGEEEFGPYTLADLQNYVQAGNISAQDLAQSEGMSDWVPVSQILGDIPIPVAPTPGTFLSVDPNAPAMQQFVSLPPNLHWGWLLLLDVITRSYFNMIWIFVQANWARKLSGKNTALVLVAMYPAGIIAGGVAIALGTSEDASAFTAIGYVVLLAGIVCLIVGTFSVRGAMEQYYNTVENIGLSLSGVMTFFFGVIYLQYHINRIARWKKTGMLS